MLKLLGHERNVLVPSVYGGVAEVEHAYRVLTDQGEELWTEVESLRRPHSKRFKAPGRNSYLMIAGMVGKPWHYRPDGFDGTQAYRDVDLSNPDDIRAPYSLTRAPLGYSTHNSDSLIVMPGMGAE